MKLYSTKHLAPEVSFEEAIFKGLPSDNGLYMPSIIPVLPNEFFDNIQNYTFQEIAFTVAHALIGNDIPSDVLKEIIDDAVNFDAPVVELNSQIAVLELFHGPSLAFKDFGARFMSRVMSYFLKKSSKKLHILVATSGDTGGAVAMGFLNTPGINVTILYPSGKVSEYQEMQLTSLGGNISAIEINGTFDDCQLLVKQAFLDQELANRLNLSSANSINISRLIPQTFYYFNAYAQAKRAGKHTKLVFCVPSGNFGNIGAGLLAKRMGLPIYKFVASTNLNDIFPKYLLSGNFEPRASIKTLSNAMDVGNPSNFQRIIDLYGNDINKLREDLVGFSFNDDDTERAIWEVLKSNSYMMCPHTAVAYLGLVQFLKSVNDKDVYGILLSTAHPAKFVNELKPDLADKVVVPSELEKLLGRDKVSIKMDPNFEKFKDYLTQKYNIGTLS